MLPRPDGYIYGYKQVRLLLSTQPSMTWGMWADVLYGMRRFLEEYDFVALEYGVWEIMGHSEFFHGNGNLFKSR